MANDLDSSLPRIAQLLLIVLNRASLDGERNNAYSALQQLLAKVDPDGHGLAERIKAPPAPPVNQDELLTESDLQKAYDSGYQASIADAEQRRHHAVAVVMSPTGDDLSEGCNGFTWREIVGHCLLNKNRIRNDWEANTFIPSVAEQLKDPHYELSSKQTPIVRRIFSRWFNGKI